MRESEVSSGLPPRKNAGVREGGKEGEGDRGCESGEKGKVTEKEENNRRTQGTSNTGGKLMMVGETLTMKRKPII